VLVGGDVTRGRDAVISVQVTGEVAPDRVLRRAAARPGQLIYVTGMPGEAAGGLALLCNPEHPAAAEDRERLVARFARPDVHVGFAWDIAGSAAAAIDVSDGLFADAGKLLAASGAGGRLELESVPLSGPLARVFGEEQAVRLALTGGDDYELCFTADPAKDSEIRSIADRHRVTVTCIGRVTPGTNLVVTRGGRELDFSDPGYRHF
jgi:thiamine-monophosphate kinase